MNGLKGVYLLAQHCCLQSRPVQWPNLVSLLKVENFGHKCEERGQEAEGKGMNK